MQLAIVKHPVRSNKNCVADSNNFLTAITLPPGCIGTTSFPGDLNAGTYHAFCCRDGSKAWSVATRNSLAVRVYSFSLSLADKNLDNNFDIVAIPFHGR